MKKINCLITGITGMVGSHLLDFLLQKTNWNIYGLCRWSSKLDNVNHHLKLINAKKRVYLLYGDLNDQNSIQKVVQKSLPHYVFHLAAETFPKMSFDAPLKFYDTNIKGTQSLLEELKNCKQIDPLVHVCSSSEIFGKVKKKDLPINENCGFHPASPYAISKVGTDLISRYFYQAYGLKTFTTRMFTHTGPRRGDYFAESTFAKQIAMIEVGAIKPTIKVGNLNSLRTIADVRDAVRAYYLLLTKNLKPGSYYNIGGTYSCTVGDILNYLINLSPMKKKIKIIKDPLRFRKIDADLQVPDSSLFKKNTGWKPLYTFEQTMRDLLNYWREQAKKKNFLDR
jgi:GDP-mannose 4,6-dehydratase